MVEIFRQPFTKEDDIGLHNGQDVRVSGTVRAVGYHLVEDILSDGVRIHLVVAVRTVCSCEGTFGKKQRLSFLSFEKAIF